MSAPGLVTELVEALGGFVRACRCRGTGRYLTDCTLCGDSTEDHACNDREAACEKPLCVAARRALARATPEAVREADAAPDLAVALRADWNGLRAIAATLRAPEGAAQEAAVRELRRLIDRSAEALAMAGERP